MNVARYEPWEMLEKFQNEMGRLLSQRAGTGAEEDGSAVATSHWAPAVDIREENDRFVIHADIPGVEPKDIEVTMDRGVLTIQGTRNRTTREGEAGFTRFERSFGSFYRRFSLPDSADPEAIQATGNHGVLEVVIPKRAQAQPKRIEVQ